MKKSLHTLFLFIVGIFIVSGLSYFSTTRGLNSNPPVDNTFVPINEGSGDQLRCKAKDTTKALSPATSGYTLCDDASPLFTNGLFVKTPNTWFTILGDPNSSNTKYRNGGLFVGCEDSTNPRTPASVRDLCRNPSQDYEPPAYLFGDIVLDELQGSGERQLCINNTGQVVVCP